MALPQNMFRFLDLPREIRNEIYCIALCSFEPRSTTVTLPLDADANLDINSLARAEHAIQASILLVSKQIHREAYDTMIKTNRFVRITTSAGLPLRALLNHLRVPVVAEGRQSIHFKGYVLSVSLTCPKDVEDAFRQTPLDTDPCSLMLLGRDMHMFCDILMDGDVSIPGFRTKVALKIAVAPGSIQIPSSFKEPVLEFFSETTQQALLQPFCDRLRGFQKAKVCGLISPGLAKAVEEILASDVATDPQSVLTNFQTQKDEGQDFYKSREIGAACLKWQDAVLEIEILRLGSSWTTLASKGGIPFVTCLAEIYFRMKLNVIHIKIDGVQKGELYADAVIRDAIHQADQSLKEGYWIPGYKWKPSNLHKAKFCYRMALFFRLVDDWSSVRTAVDAIERAHRLLPHDASIAKEREAILAWSSALSI